MSPGQSGGAAIGALHVVESWLPVVSGYTTRSAALVAAQVRARLDPAVLVTSRQHLYDDGSPAVPAGMEGRVLAATSSAPERARRRVRRWAVDGRALTRAVETAATDLGAGAVHSHFSSTIGTASARAARRLGVPLVAEVRFDLAGAALSQSGSAIPGALADRVEGPLRRWFERHLAGADAIVAASTSLGELLEATVPGVRGRVAVIPNGVDVERFAPGPAPDDLRERLGLRDALVVGSTAKMLRYEGLDLLIEAVARLASAHPRLRLILVGDGPEEARLRALAARLRAPVVFTGAVPAHAVADHYRLVDVFAIPRRSVPVTRYAAPLKLLEAMASGLPVVASPVGDVPSLLADGRGTFSPPGDVAGLALLLDALLTDAASRAAMGAAARTWALDAATWDAAAQSAAGLYASLGVTAAMAS